MSRLTKFTTIATAIALTIQPSVAAAAGDHARSASTPIAAAAAARDSST